MRINWSNLVIVLLLIAIFSIQTFSTSELTSSNQSDNSPSHITTTSGLQSQTQTQTLVQSQVNNTNLRNMSMLDLFNYLQFSSSQVKNSFIDSADVHLDTSVTTARALAILKITGMTNYIVPVSSQADIFKTFGTSVDGGFPVNNVTANPSIIGTYGVVEATQMMNLPIQMSNIKTDAKTFIDSKYQNNTKMGGFKEAYETGILASVHTTYYAVEALKALGFQVSATQKTQITAFLSSLWNTKSHYFNNTYDADQSVILTSFQAISILNDIGTNASFWTAITSGFSAFIKSNQDQTGIFTGGIHSPGAVATVDDTGSALSALYILKNTSAINIGSAVQFILQSQYNGTTFSNDKGGFANNNSTFVSTSHSSGVTLTHTYFAILGLYASGYISNHTNLSFETQYSKNNNFNKLTNEIPVGENSNLTVKLSMFDYKNYYGELNVQFSADKLNVVANGTNEANAVLGSQYNFIIYNASSNFYLGPHPLTATYSLSNFTILPVMNNAFHSSINVRFPISNTLNGLSSSVQVNPGDTLTGEMIFGNNTVNATNFRTVVPLGNVSASLIYPDGTQSSPIKNFSLVLTNSTYSYTITLPKNATLGDYMVNLTYYNKSALFYTEQAFTVTTAIYLLGITSTQSRNIYPGTGYGLTFQLAYSNGFMSSQFSNAQVKFIAKATNQEQFKAPLQYIGGTSFTINNANTVPAGLFMGTYNVSIEMLWNSSLTSNSLPTTSSNSSLPFISYQGLPIIQKYVVSPLVNRSTTNQYLFSGDLFNLTADIGVKNLQNSVVYPVNSSVTMTANFYNTSNSKQLLQQLSTEYLNGSKISIYGEMNPNINFLGNVNLSLSLRIKYSSTNTYNLLYTNVNNITNEYNPTFTYKQAHLELDQNSVNFVIGSSKITQNEYTTILITFKIRSKDNNQSVTGLKLNASIFNVNSGNSNTSISLPAVTSLQANNSYQLQIPVNTLSVGSYNITITPINTHINLGSISLSIEPVKNSNVIPLENYLSAGAVLIAVIVSYVAYRIKKKN